MPPKKERMLVLYPEYFDSSLSRAEGRRVPRASASEDVTVERVAAAVRALGLEPVVEEKAAYPCRWWRRGGRVVVKKTMAKEKLLLKVAGRLGGGGASPGQSEGAEAPAASTTCVVETRNRSSVELQKASGGSPHTPVKRP